MYYCICLFARRDDSLSYYPQKIKKILSILGCYSQFPK
jgi:hypothetical protein